MKLKSAFTSVSSVDFNGNNWHSDNRGRNLMSKMGWKNESGLGKSESGIKSVIKQHVNPGQSGLGCQTSSQFAALGPVKQMDDFNKLLCGETKTANTEKKSQQDCIVTTVDAQQAPIKSHKKSVRRSVNFHVDFNQLNDADWSGIMGVCLEEVPKAEAEKDYTLQSQHKTKSQLTENLTESSLSMAEYFKQKMDAATNEHDAEQGGGGEAANKISLKRTFNSPPQSKETKKGDNEATSAKFARFCDNEKFPQSSLNVYEYFQQKMTQLKSDSVETCEKQNETKAEPDLRDKTNNKEEQRDENKNDGENSQNSHQNQIYKIFYWTSSLNSIQGYSSQMPSNSQGDSTPNSSKLVESSSILPNPSNQNESTRDKSSQQVYSASLNPTEMSKLFYASSLNSIQGYSAHLSAIFK